MIGNSSIRSVAFPLCLKWRAFCSSSASKPFDVHRLLGAREGIVLFSLNRPETKNAMSRSLISQMINAIDSVVEDKSVRVVIVRSDVPNAFCSGADLKERSTMTQEEVRGMVTSGLRLMTSIERMPMPVIAAIDGPALGGGLEMALACDLRVAVNTAKIGLTETKLAIIPGAGGTQRLPRAIGRSLAKELIFTGRILDGETALKLGIVNYCVPQNSDGNAAFERALLLAEEILPQGPVALRAAKMAIDRGSDVDIDSGLNIEKLCYEQVIPTKDRLEGIKAFLEKRRPKYLGE